MAAARAGRGRADAHHRPGRGDQPGGDRRGRAPRRRSSPASAATPTRRPVRRRGRGRIAGSPPTRRCARSARPGSTTTATARAASRPAPRLRGPDRDRRASAGLPIVIHARDHDGESDGDRRVFETLDARADGVTVILHCFSRPGAGCRGGRARLVLLVRRQRHLSRAPRRCAKRPPRFPTTCCWSRPTRRFLAPQPLRGKPNEPAYVVETAEVVAEARGSTTRSSSAASRPTPRGLFGW